MDFIQTHGITILEFSSAVLILLGFEFINRKNIKGFHVMAIGQLIAAGVCSIASLWFLSFMHFINFLMQIRGYIKWKKEQETKVILPK